MMIKVILLVALLAAAVLAYRTPINARNSALRRIAGMALLLVACVAVLWPRLVTAVAQLVGVGRGADLVAYIIAVVSLLVWLSLYRRVHDLEYRLTLLARELAKQSIPYGEQKR